MGSVSRAGLAGAAAGRRILDVASGFGQDARALAAQGAVVVAAEPSARMSALARMQDAESEGPHSLHLRGWADALPFADGCFDAVICAYTGFLWASEAWSLPAEHRAVFETDGWIWFPPMEGVE